MSNDELIEQAKDWGFNCHKLANGALEIFPEEKKLWYLIWDGQYWVLFSQGHASINFYPEDVVQFLKERRSPSQN